MFSNKNCLLNRAKIIDDWSWDELLKLYDQLYTAGPKIGIFYNAQIFPWIQSNLNRSKPPSLLEMRFMFESISLGIKPLHFLYDAFDRKIQQYIEADLISYHINKWLEKFNSKKFEKFQEPFAVLTLGELEAGFVISLLPLVSSLFVFAIEWMPRLKDLIIFLIIFKKYFEAKNLEQERHCKLMKIKFAAWQVIIKRQNSGNAESVVQND